ncbi:hypothetical protein [Paeniglutamicibacter cryotolerans]|uniref:Uncharacterized protein n=1 Tax=Paeniglutamicibacter cryotolerans TaxID=670079 RepID=A0A839QS78_9MICC|nr:hypothetical protein [Paeniglutamicibacter cryotolerans]MBB2997535.1 hypothetical protein [Paeniglutamicibacter cryotolerans]
MASKRPPRRSASSLIEGAGSIAATFEAEQVQSNNTDKPSKKSLTELAQVRTQGEVAVHPPREMPAPVAPSAPHLVQATGVVDSASSPPSQTSDPAVHEPPAQTDSAGIDYPQPVETALRATNPDIEPRMMTDEGIRGEISKAPMQPAIRKPVSTMPPPVVRHRSPMSAYNKALGQLNKVILETDLATDNGRGVFDDYSTNMTRIRYEKGVTYNDLLPLTFTTGFNSGLERTTFQLTQHQVEEAKKFSNYLGREIRRNGGEGQKVVRSSAVSMLHRIMQDFFIANAPQDCFDGVEGEQSARAAVGLQPLPELEIYEHAVASHDPSTGPMDPRIAETSLVTPEGWGVFDDFTTNMTKIRYEKGVTYNDLLPITFATGFNSGLERATFQMTVRQIEESKKFSSYLSREIKNSLPPSLRAVRSTAVSMLHRIMQDFFIANAPADCFDGVSNEQEARAHVGLPPLPELEIFEYEINKQVRKLASL